MREKVLAEFEESLKGQPGLDEAGMELLLSEFEKAIQSTPINLEAKPIDPDDIAKNLNDLVDAGILGEDDRNELARKFEGLNEPFDNKEVKVAIEFARRCEQEGQAAAYAWLEAQRSSVAESKFATQSGFEKIEGNHQVKRPRGRPNRTRGSPV